MPCFAIHRLTFRDLLSAFLELSVVYILLWGSTLAYCATKFLGFFGLYSPCSCSNLSGDYNGNHCLQRLLVDCPSQKTSSLRSFLKSKFPFRLVGCKNQLSSKSEEVGSEEEEPTASSFKRMSNKALSENGFVIGAMDLLDEKEGKLACAGKTFSRNKARRGIKHRRKATPDNGTASFASLNSVFSSTSKTSQAPEVIGEASKDNTNFGGGKDSPMEIDLKRRVSNVSEMNDEKSQDYTGPAFNAKNKIRELEQALEQVHGARTVLYAELEKERSAAATAAEEAMAMIMRLQEEKAAIQMDTRQYQRMIEDKYVYDSEEMNLLKELLLRRERDKYFLEKEVEAYRQVMSWNKQFNPNTGGIRTSNEETLRSCDDSTMLAMQQISVHSVDKKGKTENLIDFSELPSRKSDASHDNLLIGNIPGCPGIEKQHSQVSSISGGINQELREIAAETADKHLIFDQENQASRLNSVSRSEHNPDNEVIHQETQHLQDVPVIQDQSNSFNKTGDNRGGQPEITLSATKRCDVQKAGSGLPPSGNSRRKALRSHLRRKSMSAFDMEKIKIDSEINLLRERLKMVQEGRDKINTSNWQQFSELSRLSALPPITSKVMSKKRRWPSGPLPAFESS